jgi:hypothetical protein
MVIWLVYPGCGLSLGFVFVNAATVYDGVAVGRALMQHRLNDGDTLALQGGSRFLREPARRGKVAAS